MRSLPTTLRLKVMGLLACAGLVLGLGGSAEPTAAAWTMQAPGQGSFTTVKVPQVGNLQCLDSQSPLNTGLLQTQVKLTWERPAGLPDIPLEYLVSWQESGLFTNSGTFVTEDTSFVYQRGGLSLITLGVGFTIMARPVGSTWQGEPAEVDVSSVSVAILGVYLKCPEAIPH